MESKITEFYRELRMMPDVIRSYMSSGDAFCDNVTQAYVK